MIASDQNRTDIHSLEGYCSTIELQTHYDIPTVDCTLHRYYFQ